jgi:hypothetical protein
MSALASRTVGQMRGMSNRTRLFTALAALGVALAVALTVVGVARAAFWVQFVGSGSCAQEVWPGSDQIDNGYSQNGEVDSYTDSGQCTHIVVQGSMKVYLKQSDGTVACSGTGYGHVTCVANYPYTRAHCVNTSSSSIRWMECYKYRL